MTRGKAVALVELEAGVVVIKTPGYDLGHTVQVPKTQLAFSAGLLHSLLRAALCMAF